MTRRYDLDCGQQRLTLADVQLTPDDGSVVIQHDGGALDSAPEILGRIGAGHVWIACPDAGAAWASIGRHTREVHAAGGLLQGEDGALLCIHRLGHWDLPKGKVEPGEGLEEAAAREVQEECGVPLPVVEAPFATTHHLYGKDLGLMKVTHWFTMSPGPGTDAAAVQPQTEEGIEEVRWALPEEVEQLEQGAYGNIARLMRAWRANG